MEELKIRKGLSIPIKGAPKREIEVLESPTQIAIDLRPYSKFTALKIAVKPGDKITPNDPIAFDPHSPPRRFFSPYEGACLEVIRGDRRRPLFVSLEKTHPLSSHPTKELNDPFDMLVESGGIHHIFKRPIERPAEPSDLPKAIYVKAGNLAPFQPPPSLDIKGNEALCQRALSLLAKIAPVFFIHTERDIPYFEEARSIYLSGEYPASNLSTSIAAFTPIQASTDCVWTLSHLGLLSIGSLLLNGFPYLTRYVSIGGEGVNPEERKIYKTEVGAPLTSLSTHTDLIAGDILLGMKSPPYLGLYDQSLTRLAPPPKRKLLPFFRPGFDRYSATRTYPKRSKNHLYSFTSAMHGDLRPFVMKSTYQKVMPHKIQVELLIKALLAKDFNEAISLGFLTLEKEDLAPCEFICPSKLPLMEIFEEGQKEFLSLYF